MSWLKLKRILFYPFDEYRMRRSVEQRYKLKPTTDIVRKYEEFRYKHLEALKKGAEDKDAIRFGNFVTAFKWVLNGQEKTN